MNDLLGKKKARLIRMGTVMTKEGPVRQDRGVTVLIVVLSVLTFTIIVTFLGFQIARAIHSGSSTP
jgi:hypothetical protein